LAGLSVAALFAVLSVDIGAQNTATTDKPVASAPPVVAAPAKKPEAPLVDAMQRGDKPAVLALLKKKVDPNATQPDGATALHWAAYLDDADATAKLIQAGAKVDVANDYGMTPLALAATNGNAAVIDLLLKAGADVNRGVRSNETPLMLAARSGKVDAVQLLLESGAQVNARESWNGQSALMWAAAEGNTAVVEALIKGGADIKSGSNGGTTPLLFAVRKGDMASVKALLNAGADVNEKRVPDHATPLLVAIINGYEDLVDYLLDKGADPNAEGGSTQLTVPGVKAQTPKIDFKKPDLKQQFLEVGTEGGNGRNNTFGRPLQAAVHVANWHVSDQFISVNMDRLRVIKSLIKHGADVNGRNTDMEPRWDGARYRRRLVGATAFLFAAKAGDVEVMKLLLENGADPKINTDLNITPLMAAAGISWASNQDKASEEQVLEAVKLLVEQCGLDVNFVADTGETAMHAAAYRGANSVVQYLFDKGAKLDVADKAGRTPLKIAEGVEYGNSFAAMPHTEELLRKLGAKDIPCPNGCLNLMPESAWMEVQR
jgi:ankyrin repeat protein